MPRNRQRRGGEDLRGREGVELEIHKHLTRFGVSGPGREWVLRALHPASEKKSPGLPDESATFVLRPDFRITATISSPPGASVWDCYIWAPPGDVNCLYWATAPSPADFTSPQPPNGAQVGVINLQSVVFNDPSFSYLVQYGPATQSSLTNLPALRAAAFRHQFKSITIEQIASAVSDQGQVYAGQFSGIPKSVGLCQLNGYDSGVTIPPGPLIYGLIAEEYTSILPASEVALSRMNPDYYQAPSREGVYIPVRLSGPNQPFVRSTTGSTVHTTSPSYGGVSGSAGFLAADASAYPIGAVMSPNGSELGANYPSGGGIPWPFAVTVTTLTSPDATEVALPGRQTFDTGYDNMNTAVIIFRGLQGSGGGGFGASLNLKVIAGLEVAPIPSQGDAVFAERPAPFEPRALEAYYRMALELKGVYPARFNSFEDILGAIGDVARKVWSSVEPAVVGGLSQLANTGVSMLTNMAGRRMGMLGGPRMLYRAPSAARSMPRSVSVVSTSRKPPARVKVRARK